MKNFFKILAITFVALVVIGSLTSTNEQTTSEIVKETKTHSVMVGQTFEGTGDGNTILNKLAGDYTVEWFTFGNCYYSADLVKEGDSSGDGVFSSMDTPSTGKTYIYGLDEAFYYIKMITGPSPGCGWSIFFTPN
jgi:hypothetical protein